MDTLLNSDDYGGIETWQGGPAYVYDNISGNPGGYRNWDHAMSPDTEDRFGHAYYLDGAFKNYYFNNIAWGKSKGPAGKLANTSAFQEIISYQNTFFNNTVYNFVRASRRQAPQAGRNKFLGNILQGMGLSVFRDADPARSAAGNEADAGPPPRPLRARDRRLRPQRLPRHRPGRGLRRARALGPLADDVRVVPRHPRPATSRWPRASASWPSDRRCATRPAHDFRPSAGSAARGLGAKVFVPWGLYETVGRVELLSHRGRPGAHPGRALVHVALLHRRATTTTSSPRIRSRASTSRSRTTSRPAGELDHGRPAPQRPRPVRRAPERRRSSASR